MLLIFQYLTNEIYWIVFGEYCQKVIMHLLKAIFYVKIYERMKYLKMII